MFDEKAQDLHITVQARSVAALIKYPDGSADGGVQALFTIAGRSDAPGCAVVQPDFATELARNNIALRIPTPLFGAGLIEQIPDSVILANQAADTVKKNGMGIRGRAHLVRHGGAVGQSVSGLINTIANDSTVARFGWKAQNKSLLLFAAEAYNVEMESATRCFKASATRRRNVNLRRRPTISPTPTR